jgi:hypothetical protein
MAGDDKKSKTPPKEKPPSKEKTSVEAPPKDKSSEDKTPAEAPAKTETTGEAKVGTAPSTYSRGEGQKPVSQAYKDNWNAIYAKKKNKRKKR